MFPLSSGQKIDLAPARCQSANILTSHSKQHEFGNIAKVETDAPAVWPAILTDLVPHEVALVFETPRFHDLESFRQKSIWNP